MFIVSIWFLLFSIYRIFKVLFYYDYIRFYDSTSKHRLRRFILGTVNNIFLNRQHKEEGATSRTFIYIYEFVLSGSKNKTCSEGFLIFNSERHLTSFRGLTYWWPVSSRYYVNQPEGCLFKCESPVPFIFVGKHIEQTERKRSAMIQNKNLHWFSFP